MELKIKPVRASQPAGKRILITAGREWRGAALSEKSSPLSCHLSCVTSRALLRLSHRAEVGPDTCGTAGQEEPAKGFRSCLWHPHRHWLPCLQTRPRRSLTQGHGLRDEERAVVAATREETLQGPKIGFIAKAFHAWDFSYREKVDH